MSQQSKNIKKRLQLGKFKLDTLLEVTKGINNNLSKDELLSIYKTVLLDNLKIGKLLLFSFDKKGWTKELCIGTDSNQIDVNIDLLDIKEIEVLSDNTNKNLRPFDVIVPVFHKKEPLAYLLLGDFDGEKIEVSPIIKHLTFVQTLTNVIIVAVENKRLFNENLEKIVIEKEMELASQMQAMLFPKNLPNNDEIEVSASYNPHQLVGGDYYDFIELNRDEIAFCIADVSGKGVPAALLMSNFQASLRVLIKRTTSLSELVIELNKNILANANREKFITAFIGKYNLQTRNLQYINAGHNPPLLLVGHQFQHLIDGCTILGMFENLPSVTEKNLTIPRDSILTCYTDGVVEQPNTGNEEFGMKKLENTLLLSKEESTKNILSSITEQLIEFKKEVEFKDDIALMCLRIK
jgi:sigma-B regulation protein RsbU (phosphoserine phosphatase)